MYCTPVRSHVGSARFYLLHAGIKSAKDTRLKHSLALFLISGFVDSDCGLLPAGGAMAAACSEGLVQRMDVAELQQSAFCG